MAFYIAYLALSIVHIWSCGKDNQKLRRITKVFLMPCLALVYFLAKGEIIWVYFALLFGWIGDIVLLKPQEYREKFLGSCLFAVGHLFYLFSTLLTIRNYPVKAWWAIPVLAGAAVGFAVYQKNKEPIIQKMRTSCFGYFLLLGAMVGLSVVCATFGLPQMYFRAFGYVLFLVSDAVLVTEWFTVGDPHPKSDVIVMVTYCLAQALIVLSFLVG